MQFLNPLALAGLAAALIPLAIHLLHQGQKRPQPFSNLRFLRQLHHSHMRRLRLRQWLVLLLRTLILVLLATAFARPAYRGGGLLGGSGSTAAAVVLDRSFSTGYRQGPERLFDGLRRGAEQTLGLFGAADRTRLFLFDQTVQESGDGSPEKLQELVSQTLPGQGGTDPAAALKAAATFLKTTTEDHREIFLFTDLAGDGWDGLGDLRDGSPGTSFYIAAPPPDRRPNVHLDAVGFDPWLAAVGVKRPLTLTLANSSDAPTTVGLDLFINGDRVDHREVDLAAGQKRGLQFAVAPRRAGRVSGYVEADEDGLPLDNRRYFALQVPQRLRVLLVGERPEDSYYPRRALTAAAAGDPSLEIRAALMGDWDAELSAWADVVFVCHARRLATQRISELRRFVEAGGGLAFFLAPDADLNHFNRYVLPEFIPLRLQGISGRPGDPAAAQRLDPDAHPLFAGLLKAEPGDQPTYYAAFEAVPAEGLEPLLRLQDGRIVLAQGWRGQGRTVVLTAPLAIAWGDLPLKGLFVPFMQRLARYLALPPQHAEGYTVGQSVRRHIAGTVPEDRIQAQAPSGKRLFLAAEPIGGRLYWKLPRLDEAGIWRLLRAAEEVDRFAVNHLPHESVLAPADRDAVARLLGPERTHFLDLGEDLGAQVLTRRYGRELWRECLLAALVLLLLEMWLARGPQSTAQERRAA